MYRSEVFSSLQIIFDTKLNKLWKSSGIEPLSYAEKQKAPSNFNSGQAKSPVRKGKKSTLFVCYDENGTKSRMLIS